MQNNSDKKFPLTSLPAKSKIMALAVALMCADICYMLSSTWSTRLDYSFGYLTPIFVLYIIYDKFGRAKDILTSKPAANNRLLNVFCDFFFGSMLVCGTAVFAFFLYIFYRTLNWGTPSFAATFGFSFAAFASTYFIGDTNSDGERLDVYSRLKFTLLFVFPCFIWLVSAPIFSAVEKHISLMLLSKVASVVVTAMDWLGFVVELRGNTISFPGGTVGVADACSGIRSLTACLFAGSFLAAALLDKIWKKVLLVGMSMVFAFAFNLVRALFLTLWAYEYGSQSISGFVHDAAGYFVLGMTVVALLILTSIFNINPVPEEFRQGKGQPK